MRSQPCWRLIRWRSHDDRRPPHRLPDANRATLAPSLQILLGVVAVRAAHTPRCRPVAPGPGLGTMMETAFAPGEIDGRYEQKLHDLQELFPDAAPGSLEVSARAWAQGDPIYQPRRNGAVRHVEPPPSEPQRFPRAIDIRDLASRDPTAREWFVEGLIPSCSSILLAGNGGVNKTLLILMLAVCVALGMAFFGIATTRHRVLAVFSEDDDSEIHRRLRAICAALGVDISELAGHLFVYDGLGADVALFGRRAAVMESGRSIYTAGSETTAAYDWLATECRELQPELLILDGVSDMFDGEENRRADVRRYINATFALVQNLAGAVIHNAHVDKFVARGGASNGQTYSGSTAWNNSVRARLSLTQASPWRRRGHRRRWQAHPNPRKVQLRAVRTRHPTTVRPRHPSPGARRRSVCRRRGRCNPRSNRAAGNPALPDRMRQDRPKGHDEPKSQR